jgi:hypothetical protein
MLEGVNDEGYGATPRTKYGEMSELENVQNKAEN